MTFDNLPKECNINIKTRVEFYYVAAQNESPFFSHKKFIFDLRDEHVYYITFLFCINCNIPVKIKVVVVIVIKLLFLIFNVF